MNSWALLRCTSLDSAGAPKMANIDIQVNSGALGFLRHNLVSDDDRGYVFSQI